MEEDWSPECGGDFLGTVFCLGKTGTSKTTGNHSQRERGGNQDIRRHEDKGTEYFQKG